MSVEQGITFSHIVEAPNGVPTGGEMLQGKTPFWTEADKQDPRQIFTKLSQAGFSLKFYKDDESGPVFELHNTFTQVLDREWGDGVNTRYGALASVLGIPEQNPFYDSPLADAVAMFRDGKRSVVGEVVADRESFIRFITDENVQKGYVPQQVFESLIDVDADPWENLPHTYGFSMYKVALDHADHHARPWERYGFPEDMPLELQTACIVKTLRYNREDTEQYVQMIRGFRTRHPEQVDEVIKQLVNNVGGYKNPSALMNTFGEDLVAVVVEAQYPNRNQTLQGWMRFQEEVNGRKLEVTNQGTVIDKATNLEVLLPHQVFLDRYSSYYGAWEFATGENIQKALEGVKNRKVALKMQIAKSQRELAGMDKEAERLSSLLGETENSKSEVASPKMKWQRYEMDARGLGANFSSDTGEFQDLTQIALTSSSPNQARKAAEKYLKEHNLSVDGAHRVWALAALKRDLGPAYAKGIVSSLQEKKK